MSDRETLFFSIRCFIEAVAGDRPTMLVFEDIHWAHSSLLDLIELLGLSEEEFRRRFRHTPLLRTKRAGLLRNAAIALGNLGDERALPALERALGDTEKVIREAAAWAIGRISEPEALAK